MKLSFVFSQLAGSELAQLALVDQTTGKLLPDKYQKVVDAINLGLIELHGKFLLKIGEVKVPITLEQEVYKLSAVDPKIGAKMIQLHNVVDQDGRVLEFNNFSARNSVHFTQKTVLNVPLHLRRDHNLQEVRIQYKAMPRQVGGCYDTVDPDIEDVDLDYQFVKALMYFVAARMHNPVGISSDAAYQPNIFYNLYAAEVLRLEEENYELSYVAKDETMHLRGWP